MLAGQDRLLAVPRSAPRGTLSTEVIIHRCPRCRAEDISADAHPVRVIRGDRTEIVAVCRSCYRVAELEYRLACDSAGIPYAALPIRQGLFALAEFYERRLAALDDPDVLL